MINITIQELVMKGFLEPEDASIDTFITDDWDQDTISSCFLPKADYVLSVAESKYDGDEIIVKFFELVKDEDDSNSFKWLVHLVIDIDPEEYPEMHPPIGFEIYKKMNF